MDVADPHRVAQSRAVVAPHATDTVGAPCARQARHAAAACETAAHAKHSRISTDNSVITQPATAALPAVAMDPATAALPAVAMDPATAALPAVAIDPATAALPAVGD